MENQFVVAGVIRPVNGKWQWIGNGHYHLPDYATVEQDTGTIVIRYGITTAGVVTFIAATDETLAAGGYTVGASVTRELARVSLYRRDGTRVLPTEPIPANANIWIYGLFII